MVAAVALLGASTASAAACSNEQTREREANGTSLPDCRAYELVTPAVSEGATLAAGGFIVEEPGFLVSESGERVEYATNGSAFPGAPAAGAGTQQTSSLTPQGWQISFPIPRFEPEGALSGASASAFSADLSESIVLAHDALLPGELSEGSPQPYLGLPDQGNFQSFYKSEPDGKFTAILKEPLAEPENYGPEYIAVDKAFNKVIYEAKAPLLPERLSDPENPEPQLFEWVETGSNGQGETRLVARGEDGQPLSSGVRMPGIANLERAPGAISADGSHVFFDEVNPPERLYVRIDGERTIEISRAQREVPDPNDSGESRAPTFEGAVSDGTRSFFTSTAELTGEAYTGSDDNARNLYEYNEETGRLTDLTVDHEAVDAGLGAQVQGVMQLSEDGTYVYFVADGVLAPGTAAGSPTDGQPNLYLSRETAGGARQTIFIATLSSANSEEWTPREQNHEQTEITPSGEHLLFLSSASLAGFENVEGNDNELFEYNAPEGSLNCISCNPSGAQPTSSASLLGRLVKRATRNMNEDGSIVVFQTSEALVSGDINDAPDVYEYEDGQVHLLSDGVAPNVPAGAFAFSEGTEYVGMGRNGQNIFVVSHDALAPTGQAGLLSIYDVRVGAELPPVTALPCSGEACQGTSTGAPSFATPGTASTSGPGNVGEVAKPKAKPKKKTKKKVKTKKKKTKSKGGRQGKAKRGKSRKKGKAARRNRSGDGVRADASRQARGI